MLFKLGKKPLKKSTKPSKSFWWLIGLIMIGIWWRWQKIDWGNGFFYHPDENNLATSLTRLSLVNLDSGFFAYGPLSGYLVFFSFKILSFLTGSKTASLNFSQAVFGLRFLSALTSSLTVFVIYKIARRFRTQKIALLAAALTSLIPGLIQAAHFGTTESLLGFQLSLIVLLSLSLLDKIGLKKIIPLSLLLGSSLATKASGLVFFLVPLAAIFLSQPLKKNISQKIFLALVIILIGITTSAFLAPYQLLRFAEFKKTINYETEIARGIQSVFYTRQFDKTAPIYFQFTKIFPYAFGWGLTLVVFLGFSQFLVKPNKKTFYQELLIMTALAAWFFSNAFLFTKWTRFMIPIFPLLTLVVFFGSSVRTNKFRSGLIWGGLIFQLGQSLFFTQIYRQPDVRIQANAWLNKNLSPGVTVLTEPRNVGRLPDSRYFQVIEPDLYSLNSPQALVPFAKNLAEAEYLIIPSRRLFANHLFENFPYLACYYKLLFDNQLGFTKIKEFSAPPGLKIGQKVIFSLPDELAEETWTVFDHPVIRIFKKSIPQNQMDYQNKISQCVRDQT